MTARVLAFQRKPPKRPWCQFCRGTRRAYNPVTDRMGLCPCCTGRDPAPLRAAA